MPELFSLIHSHFPRAGARVRAVSAAVGAVWRTVIDVLLPPLCLACDGPVTAEQALCPTCWSGLHFIAPPHCEQCGAPFDLPVEAGSLCGACLADPPAFAKARSALLYNDASKGIILRLKHADRLHPIPALAAWMARAGGEVWDDADMIVPVPLHRWRLFHRRYNQSALLALAIGAKTGRKVDVEVLQRVRATPTQGHLNRDQRRQNVAKAFAVSAQADIKGKHIVLIDDVLTSGATVSECARTLLAGGAARVSVVTLARTRVAT